MMPLEPDMDNKQIGSSKKKADLAVFCNACKHGKTGAAIIVIVFVGMSKVENNVCDIVIIYGCWSRIQGDLLH